MESGDGDGGRDTRVFFKFSVSDAWTNGEDVMRTVLYDGDTLVAMVTTEECNKESTYVEEKLDKVVGSNWSVLKSENVDVSSSYNEDIIEDVVILVEDKRAVEERCEDSTVSPMTELAKIMDESRTGPSIVKFSGTTPFVTWTVNPESNNPWELCLACTTAWVTDVFTPVRSTGVAVWKRLGGSSTGMPRILDELSAN